VGQGGSLLALALHDNNFGYTPLISFFSLPSSAAESSPLHLGDYPTHHSDSLTNLLFHPTIPSLLLSSSEDGTISVFDTRHPTPALSLMHVIRGGDAVPRGGLTIFGPSKSWHSEATPSAASLPPLSGSTGVAVLCGLAGSEIAVYNGVNANKMLRLKEMRSNPFTRLASQAGNGGYGDDVEGDGTSDDRDVDYFVRSVWISEPSGAGGEYYGAERRPEAEDGGYLCVIGGNFSGDLIPRVVKTDGVEPLYDADGAEVALTGGHTSTVRCVSSISGGLVTAGEDGKVCVWLRKRSSLPPSPPASSPASPSTEPKKEKKDKKDKKGKKKKKKKRLADE
jgi:WD40 repeat protein